MSVFGKCPACGEGYIDTLPAWNGDGESWQVVAVDVCPASGDEAVDGYVHAWGSWNR